MSSENGSRTTMQGYVLHLAAFVIIIAGLRSAKSLVVTMLLAFFAAIILTPVLRWLESRRIPTSIAMLLIVASLATLGGGVVAVVGQSANELVTRLPFYQQRLQSELYDIERWVNRQSWSRWLKEAGLGRDRQASNGTADSSVAKAETDTPPSPAIDSGDGAELERPFESSDQINSMTNPLAPPPLEAPPPRSMIPPDPSVQAPESNIPITQLLSLEPRSAVAVMQRILSELGGIFSSALLILITVIFVLLEASRFPDKLQAALGSGTQTTERVREIVENIRRYMFIKTSTSLLTGVMITVFLLFFDIRYAVLWGLLAFLFNYVPNIGSILASGPAIALAFVERGTPSAVLVAIGYVVVNCFISYAIEPRFMGQGLGLSTMVVFLSLLFWGWVLGPVGMLLSAPLTMIIKIVLADDEDTRWIAVMLGSKAPAPED